MYTKGKGKLRLEPRSGKTQSKSQLALVRPQVPVSSPLFSSAFVSLTPGMWPEGFWRVKELLCSPKPSFNTRCSSSAWRTYFKTNLNAEEGLG